MKKIIAIIIVAGILFACNSGTEKTTEEKPTEGSATTETKNEIVLPFKAEYSSSFTQDVSDKDLKTVLDSYVYWRDGDMDKLASLMADSAMVEMADGNKKIWANADLKKMWTMHRDSMSKVDITMQAWTKLKSDKGHDFVATWYKETDTYKTGKVDSAYYQDINQIKDGKIVHYATFKKPAR